MRAAIKAFVVNRVGDFFFMLGVALVFFTFDSIDFSEIFAAVPQHTGDTFLGLNAIELIGVLLFLGACGKSAQIGLHTWLPDAMEGPTPVSALIHAATMVTAGVFLVCRMSPLDGVRAERARPSSPSSAPPPRSSRRPSAACRTTSSG